MLLVLPTTAMGATLPLLTEALSRANPSFGATVGKLYGWNTLGAMLGAIATEAVLVRFFGIASTGLIAMLLNLAAGALALRLAAEPVGRARGRRGFDAVLRAQPTAILLVALLSGAVMLALEVVWFRFLLLTYMGTGLTFAVMLAIVLAGIGLGGLAAGRLAAPRRALPPLAAARNGAVRLIGRGHVLRLRSCSRRSNRAPAQLCPNSWASRCS